MIYYVKNRHHINTTPRFTGKTVTVAKCELHHQQLPPPPPPQHQPPPPPPLPGNSMLKYVSKDI